MDHVLNWVWQGMLVAGATFGFLRMLDRARAATRYVLCWIALLAVLVLPLVPLWQTGGAPLVSLEGAAPTGSLVEVPNAWWTSSPVLAALGIWWLAVFGIRVAGALRKVRAARARCRPIPAVVESRLVHWKAVSGRGRPARLAVSHDAETAHVLGCGAPIIAVAPALIEHLNVEELDRIVIHEWSHVQRRDDLLSLAQLGVRALAGWHPAVWWLERQLIVEREAACDEAVVALTGSAKVYASSLTKVASLRPMGQMSLATIGALSSSSLSWRVMRILSTTKFLSRRCSTAAALAVVISLAALSSGIVGVRLIGLAVPASLVERSVGTAAPIANLSQSSVTTAAVLDVRPARSARGSGRSRATARTDPSQRIAQPVTSETPADAAGERPAGSDAAQNESAALSSTPLPLGLAGLAAHAAAGHAPHAASMTPASGAPTDVESTSPWGAAAEAGVAIGRGSQKAGVATASFFSRIGKKIGRSF